MPDLPSPSSLIIGVDIGGTKTHLRALGPGGYRRDRIVPSRDWRRMEWHQDARSLLDLCASLVDGARIEALGIGAHGCDDTAECAAFQSAFENAGPTPTRVVNDAELMPLAMGMTGQIGVVAGTGSIAVHRTTGNDLLVAGGWGWIIGDEGSAAGLMREAVKAVALHIDIGGDLKDPLVPAVFNVLDVPSPARLGSALGLLGSAAAVGRHAAAVFRAAEDGSPLARRVIMEGGRAMAGLVGRLLQRGITAGHVVAGGGVITAQPLLWQAFVDGLAASTATRSVTPNLFTGKPVEGATNLARDVLLQSPHADAPSPMH